MHRTDYSVVSLEEGVRTQSSEGVTHSPLTGLLGCTEMSVDVYRLQGSPVTVSSEHEHLCIPVDGEGTITVEETWSVPSPGLGFVPAADDCTLDTDGAVTWIVVSAPSFQATEQQPVVIDANECGFEFPPTSGILTARLTDELGCIGMKVNLRRLGPGDVVPYHTEGRQQELFIPLTGAGVLRVDGNVCELPRGAVGRVAPETPRSAVNDGNDDVVWAMIGAPPTGGANDWDPGAEVLEWPGPE